MNRKAVALAVMWIFIFPTSILLWQLVSDISYPYLSVGGRFLRLLILLVIAGGVTWLNYKVLQWVEQNPNLRQSNRRKRIEKVLSQLEDDDLNLLRERLIVQEDDLFEAEQKQKRR
jgi:hypothetical protein